MQTSADRCCIVGSRAEKSQSSRFEVAMSASDRLLIGGVTPQHLYLKRANRHGLIAGATGTGKTVSLQILAEGFSAAGVPVFMADVKGDLAGLSQAGSAKPFLLERATKIGLTNYDFRAFPVVFWDLNGAAGHPVRTTITEMGPLLLARLLELNETQAGVLNIAFEVADDQGLLLLDLKDLRALLGFLGDNAASLTTEYGNVSKASIGAIQRGLLTLEQQGAEAFFGEPALDLQDFMRQNAFGQGYINILAADRLIHAPRLYATFLLWLLSELFEELPEVGDPEKPKLVFFFDEAHLLFDDAPKALVDKVTQVVRLIRSKGVGVYFVTQNPQDVPEEVLGQLGNRIQHALRAYTPRDAKAVRTAAQTFRQNPAFEAERVITELGVGEALVSTLDPKGVPGIVERTLVRPPSSRMGPIDDEQRAAVIAQSPIGQRYERAVERDSAFEMLERRAAEKEAALKQQQEAEETQRARQPTRARSSRRQGVAETFAKSLASSVGRQIGRQILRGILGSMARR
jgi:DNA helicase HerA-like ATPase